jgi:hypothetical protein
VMVTYYVTSFVSLSSLIICHIIFFCLCDMHVTTYVTPAMSILIASLLYE